MTPRAFFKLFIEWLRYRRIFPGGYLSFRAYKRQHALRRFDTKPQVELRVFSGSHGRVFTCPKCGCHEWRLDIAHGSCQNNAGCNFVWHRTDDKKYFR